MIRRLVIVAVLAGLAATAVAVRQPALPPALGDTVDPAPPRHRACIATFERGASASIQVGSVVRGPVEAGLVAGLGSTEPVVGEIDDAGGSRFGLDELGAAGAVGVLVELPSIDAAAGASGIGAGGLWATTCTPPATRSIAIAGGSTGTGETLDLVISNPYAQDAVVEVVGSSEVGVDSASSLEEIIVPARTTVSRSLDAELDLRRSLTTRLVVTRGAIHAAYVQRADGDVAIIEGVEPSADWWLPIIPIEETTTHRITVVSDSAQPVSVQIDRYTAEGVEEAVRSFSIEPMMQIDIPAEEFGEPPLGLRISADGPIAVTMVAAGEGVRSGSPALPAIGTDWLVPGAGDIGGAVWVTNPGDVAAELVLQPLAPDTPARAATVEPGETARISIDRLGSGHLVRSTSPVVMLWSSGGPDGRTLAAPALIDAGDR